jgi:hypothetical protein
MKYMIRMGRRNLDGSWIYSYICNQCLSLQKVGVRFLLMPEFTPRFSGFVCLFVCLMMFNATFNNISAISWWSVLLAEEIGGPGENDRPVASH